MTRPVAPAPPRWIAIAGAVATCSGLIVAVCGYLIAIGNWRGGVDKDIAQLKAQATQAEANDRTYIPVLVGMTRDVSYLADRARREDERASQRGR